MTVPESAEPSYSLTPDPGEVELPTTDPATHEHSDLRCDKCYRNAHPNHDDNAPRAIVNEIAQSQDGNHRTPPDAVISCRQGKISAAKVV